MNNLTIQDIIKALPLDKEVKDRLTHEYDSYDTIKKFEVYHILTKGFHTMQAEMEEVKYEQFMQEINQGKRELTETLLSDVKAAVWQDIQSIIAGKQQSEELEAVRNQLQSLINKHST